MALALGTRIEHYEILAAIGAGGMGEVYRARDTKLGRDVAFKVLPLAFAADADRLSRFQREAHVLASLNHPNIAQIYGVADAPDRRCIVMEFVEGETLQARLKAGPIPVEECIDIAKQIAEALEAAHERGILHRDLKPGNIMVSSEGKVKILDFGLAKTLESPANTDISQSPTILTNSPTEANVLMGTAAYMSPEQVRGRPADHRSDIWAFGCVLYEMLAGLQAFTGETIADLIGGITRIDPDWTALPGSTPTAAQSVLKRCLDKDKRKRFQAIGDVRYELELARMQPARVAAPAQTHNRIAWSVAALCLLIAAAVLIGAVYFYLEPREVSITRFAIELPPGMRLLTTNPIAPGPNISPDGRYVSFLGNTAGISRLWLRPLDSLTARPVSGTEGIDAAHHFWSADSRFIGFFDAGRLKKIAVSGGPPQTLSEASGNDLGNPRSHGTWSSDGAILFVHRNSIYRVSAAGGESSSVRTPDKSKNETASAYPSFLSDGNHFLYLSINSDPSRSELRVGALDSNEDKALFSTNTQAHYAEPGYILFVRDATLMAQPFDMGNFSLAGDSFPVAEGIGVNNAGQAGFNTSRNGTLIYRAINSAVASELQWFDRSGKKLGSIGRAGNAFWPSLSPDQRLVALAMGGLLANDVWLYDISRETLSRFTFDPNNESPIFSPDGKQIAFNKSRSGTEGLYVKSTGGTGAEQLIQQGRGLVSTDWSPDGQFLLYGVAGGETSLDIWALPMTGERKPYPVLNQKSAERGAKFSPDGRWILYGSDETGRQEIYVQRFPPTGAKWQVSVDGANFSHWRRDGREIIFNSPSGSLMAVDVKLGSTFEAGTPRQLFPLPFQISTGFAVTADGQRFLLPQQPDTGDRPTITVVENWTADTKR